jgi:hypothetical protein
MQYPVERTAQAFLPLMLGNAAAAQFLEQMVTVLHLWDDLIDQDKPVDAEAINRGFMTMLVDLPRNEFYAANFQHLNSILVNAITNWHIANRMEAEPDEYKLRIAYILRSSYCDLVTQCALLVGGPDYAREVGFHNRMNTHKEGWVNYQMNLEAERAARATKE